MEINKKRAERYPISQIIGNREFWSKNFIVNQHVLDPRPDSETLISTVLKYYPNKKQKLKIADFGIGTGCLLISVLSEYEYAVGIGFEKAWKHTKLPIRTQRNIIFSAEPKYFQVRGQSVAIYLI